MNPRIACIGLLLLLPPAAWAQTLTKITVTPERASIGQEVTIQIDLRADDPSRNWCGVRLNFGEGDSKVLRVEQLSFSRQKVFNAAGTYTVSVHGELSQRGVLIASACNGGPLRQQVLVVDPVAEAKEHERIKALQDQLAAAQAAASQAQAEAASAAAAAAKAHAARSAVPPRTAASQDPPVVKPPDARPK
ncbi:hypothetical protein [Ideonella sp. YS5]|uniref:hypothetical protein n=1 Tax=Ideonella sp. YS5 TaxID=3453714 RepID=UPI003EED333C